MKRKPKIAEAPIIRPTVKIYGQPRSGTNAVERIMRELGCDVRRNVGGWKHGEPALCADFVVIVEKNPYAWMASMKRYTPEPGMPVWGINGWVARENAYRAFAAIHPDRVAIATHEEMIDGWDDLVERLARFVGHADPDRVTVAPEPCAMDKSGAGVPGRPFDANWYRSNGYMDELTPNDVRLVQASLDGEVRRLYGGTPPVAIHFAEVE